MRRISPLLATALTAASLAAAGCTSAPPSDPGPGGSARRTVAPGRLSPVLMPWPVTAEGQARPQSAALGWSSHVFG
ncbi:hypothetical protein ACFVT2_22250 [Streptomyces sp. NPDC058000]|uniref:hypothetical protein n=1 Tax=Streptomyces sp. NPDC058000 TaxID=3346299 RepID=UPI0036EEA340